MSVSQNKVKFFESNSIDELEKKINDFLSTKTLDRIHSIDYQTQYNSDVDCYNAMLYYRETDEEADENSKTEVNTSNKIELTKEQALKILACLSLSIYKTDDIFINDEKDIGKLIDMSDDIQWDIADILGIDLNNCYIDYNSLEINSYQHT